MSKSNIQGGITIPVVVDAVMDSLVRCTYFSIECVTPSPGWTLDVGNISVPFIMLGLQGIVHRPMGSAESFTRPEQLDKIFDTIDALDDFFVDTNSVWFLSSAMPKAKRGDVFRAPLKLFAFGLSLDSMSLKSAKELAPNGRVAYSEAEHKAYSLWAGQQIKYAREHYKKMNKKGMTLMPRREG